MTNNKTIVGSSLAIIAVVLAIFLVSRPKATPPAPLVSVSASTVANSPEQKSAKATLEAGTSTYSLPLSTNETVENLMQYAASTTNFRYTGKEYPSMGLFVESINGRKNTGGMGWFLYVNGTSSELGASSVIVHPGDTIEWRYEQNHY